MLFNVKSATCIHEKKFTNNTCTCRQKGGTRIGLSAGALIAARKRRDENTNRQSTCKQGIDNVTVDESDR